MTSSLQALVLLGWSLQLFLFDNYSCLPVGNITTFTRLSEFPFSKSIVTSAYPGVQVDQLPYFTLQYYEEYSKGKRSTRKVRGLNTTTTSNNQKSIIITDRSFKKNRIERLSTTRELKSIQQPEANLRSLFIEETDDYPEEEIKILLKNTPENIKTLYNALNTQLDPNVNLTERIAPFTEDSSDLPKEESVCRSVIRNIYPRQAARYNSLVYIPNNQEFMQVIQAEICQYPEGECSYLQDNLPYGLVSACVQKYSYKKLLFMDPLEKRMASDLFRYPSCCTCHIRSLPLDLRSSSKAESNSTLRQPLNSVNQSLALYNSDESSLSVTTVDSSTAISSFAAAALMDESIVNQSNSSGNSTGSARQGKALTSVSSRNDARHRKAGTMAATESPTQLQVEKSIRAKKANTTTVVLHDDKVYRPSESETKK